MKKLIFMALTVILLLGIFPVSAAHHGAPPVSKILDITKGGSTSIDAREITVPDTPPLKTNESGEIDFDYYGDLLGYPQRIVLSTVTSESLVSVEISSLNNYGFSTTINIVDSSGKVITGSDKFNWGSLSYYEGWSAIVPGGAHVEILVSPIINVVHTHDALTGNLKGVEATVRFSDTINISTSTTIESVIAHNHHGGKDPPVTEIIADPPTKVENPLTDTQIDNTLGNNINSGNKINNYRCYTCNYYNMYDYWYMPPSIRDQFIPAISQNNYSRNLRTYETTKNQLNHLNDIPTSPSYMKVDWVQKAPSILSQFYGYSMSTPGTFRA